MEKKEAEKECKVVEVPTQFSPAFQIGDEEPIDGTQLLSKIYNKLADLNEKL